MKAIALLPRAVDARQVVGRGVAAARAFGVRVWRALVARREKLGAAAFGLAYFISRTDLRVILPWRVDMLVDDNEGHAIAGNFAHWDSWHWPLGRVANYLWPVGTTLVYTDSNPWVSLAAKLTLPTSTLPLQFVGLWLALTFALQGYFGARLAALATEDRWVRATVGALFVLAPVLLARVAHDTLCAQWLIVAVMHAGLTAARDAPQARRTLTHTVAATTFASGLHPTLFAMTFPLGLVSVVRHTRRAGRAGAALAASYVALPALVMWSVGAVGTDIKPGAWGFGDFSSNLLTLFDPYEASRSSFLPVLGHGTYQYEGFGYLGLGVMALIVVSTVAGLASVLRRRKWPRGVGWAAALFGISVLSAAFALSSRVMLGDRLVADLKALYAPVHTVTDGFRSSGRFIWPLHYALLAGAVLVASRLTQAQAIIVAAVSLQFMDLAHFDVRSVFAQQSAKPPSAAWDLARGEYAHLVLDPPDIESQGFRCEGAAYGAHFYMPLARIAVRERLTFNSGESARIDDVRSIEYCKEVARVRGEGKFDSHSIYLPSAALAPSYRSRPELVCGTIDAYDVCVSSRRATSFLDAIRYANAHH